MTADADRIRAAAQTLRAIPSARRAAASRDNGANGGRPPAKGPRNADIRGSLAIVQRWRRHNPRSTTPRLSAAIAAAAAMLETPTYRRDPEACSGSLSELGIALAAAKAAAARKQF